jgi:hypothetical protein
MLSQRAVHVDGIVTVCFVLPPGTQPAVSVAQVGLHQEQSKTQARETDGRAGRKNHSKPLHFGHE